MIRRIALATVLAMTLPLVAQAQQKPAPTPGPSPQALMQATAQRMLDALDADRDAYRKDRQKMDGLVDRILLPNFDTEYSARLVLGKHWRTATPQQRKRFVDAFYRSMLAKYGSALAQFTADRMTILPFRGDEASGLATVRTEVRTNDGTRVPVNYSMRATPQGWKAWDVTIEGISYIKNFRDDFGAEIEQRGVESVIARLEDDAASLGSVTSGAG
jgi:phospholipid transport system substrate-binding protein